MECPRHLSAKTKQILGFVTIKKEINYIHVGGVVNTFAPNNGEMYLMSCLGGNNEIYTVDQSTFQLSLYSSFSDGDASNYSPFPLGFAIYPTSDKRLMVLYSNSPDKITVREITDIKEDDGSSSDVYKQDIVFSVPDEIKLKQEQDWAKSLNYTRITPNYEKAVLCMEGGVVNVYDTEKQELKTLVIPCDRDNDECVLTQDVFVSDNNTAWVIGSIVHNGMKSRY